MLHTYLIFHADPPPCEGAALPSRSFYFERFYEDEIDDFIGDGRRLNLVPCYINVYRDDSDVLFSMIFGRVKNASACIILTAATTREVSQKTKELRKTHRIKTAACYRNANNRLRCIAVFCPRREVPLTKCYLHQSYSKFQSNLIRCQQKGYTVFQCKIYTEGSRVFVDVCFRRNTPYTVAFSAVINIRNLVQTIKRNEQRGFYLTDGNARLEGDNMVYSAVFSTQRYGTCDYRVISNVDALQLFERERVLARDNFQLTTIIPTTGNLTPQFIAVFWKSKS